MAKEYFDPEDFDKLFQIDPSADVAAPLVSKVSSGQAQQVQSAENSVLYKNFQGSQVEETHLVQDLHTQQINTDWTDSYDSGVTSDVTEVAPSINQQLHLSTLHSTTVNTLNEEANTTNEARSINVTNWQSYHQSIQTNIPTNLQQTIQQSGETSIDNLQSQVGTHTTDSQTYTENFGTMNINAPVTVGGGPATFNAQQIIMGGPSSAIASQLAPIISQDPVYEFYIVNTDGIYYHLTDSIDFSDIMGNFNLGDFFEEERWIPEEGTDNLSREQTFKIGVAGSVAAIMPVAYQVSVKHNLIIQIKNMHAQIKSKFPSSGGMLLQANYQVCTDGQQDQYILNNIFIAGTGTDYNALIKKVMSEPAMIASPTNNMCHWEYLFIWIVKY